MTGLRHFAAALILVAAACGEKTPSPEPEVAPPSFLESDFEENAVYESEDIEVPVALRDPFERPSGVVTTGGFDKERHGDVIPSREELTENSGTPSRSVEWPALNVSGVLEDAFGRRSTVIEGRVRSEGERVSPHVRIEKIGARSVVFRHSSGEALEILLEDTKK